ncbi:F-box only protein 9 [Fopius arisanus]|uniref:F-box only protein 9 n=2 Tax=Fopius arisanus TaxID=64838 RepID=A0A0C9R7W0_9HYME|nr:PREDICTED: F-box only protein 9 [Fopius arisanus]
MSQPGGSSGDDGGTGDGGDDQEESSSSKLNVEDALTSFREQWQRELEISPKRDLNKSNKPVNIETIEEELSIENKAKKLFLKGIEYEQNGELYDAIRFYKRAVQLVPDIEFRLYESTKPKAREKFEKDEKTIVFDCEPPDDDVKGEEEIEDGNLIVKLSRVLVKNQRVCCPRFEQSSTHISALPMEIVLYILRWVVSPDLDFRSLEMFSAVCRGFFISARDPEIWRLACVRVWGVNCGDFEPIYRSWRDMYLQRPRLRYNGCYISKNTYIRHGENSFQDQFYRPWHLVEYFRYLRFFPEGRVLMLTSTDDAQSCVNLLKSRHPRNPNILIGYYRLHENRVTLVLKKQEIRSNNNVYRKKRKEVVHDSGEQTFHVEFEIQTNQKRANFQLNWVRYNIFTKYKNGQEGTTCLNSSGRYPSFKFSRAKSYTLESDAPLQ